MVAANSFALIARDSLLTCGDSPRHPPYSQLERALPIPQQHAAFGDILALGRRLGVGVGWAARSRR
jgi:hypothetical protein